jgi:hypothetical protein
VTIALAVAGLAALLAVAVTAGVLLFRSYSAAGPECTVPGDPAGATGAPQVELTAIQLQHASTINAVGLARRLPDGARVVALATAFQESALRNRPDGDRDSVGLFQQRPSKGWGTVQQILDPVYASGAFYDALLKVPGWQNMSLTAAAQAVQDSAYPDAYAKWEPQARTLVRGLSGAVPGELSCRAGAAAPTAHAPERAPVTGAKAASPELAAVLGAAQAELGGVSVTSVSGDGRTALIDVTVPGIGRDAAARALAAWAVAHGTGFGVTGVTVDDRRWVDHAWTPGAAPTGGSVEITVGQPG